MLGKNISILLNKYLAAESLQGFFVVEEKSNTSCGMLLPVSAVWGRGLLLRMSLPLLWNTIRKVWTFRAVWFQCGFNLELLGVPSDFIGLGSFNVG